MKTNKLLIAMAVLSIGSAILISGCKKDEENPTTEMLKNNEYDIILMDLHMPVMNGFEATEYIRN